MDSRQRRPANSTLDNIIPFPHPHRGDPDPRRAALAQIGFRWTAEAWRRGRVVLTDDAIDQMDERTWVQRLRSWTRRRPQRWGNMTAAAKEGGKEWESGLTSSYPSLGSEALLSNGTPLAESRGPVAEETTAGK